MVASRGLADTHRVEIRTLEEHVRCLLRDTRVQTAEHARDTHRFLFVANHQVGCRHRALHAVQCGETLPFVRAADDDMVALNLIGIKRVQRLTGLVEHEVRYVHHVVDTPDTDCPQCVLQPFRRLVYADAFDAHARVTRAGISSLYANADR